MRVESHSINDVLTKNATSFFIPPFQRAYAWGRIEIERYFNDVMRIIQSELNPEHSDKLEHFFGTIVVKEERQGFAHRSVVVDGQQRLTTTLLFLIALRDIETDESFKNRITTRYLINDDSDFEDKIKLKQVTKDWDSYKALVNGKEPNRGVIKTAYQIFTKLINNTKKSHPGIESKHYILAVQRMNIAVIFLDERPHKGEDPQIIFETLNSLGKPLTLADLVRNFILLPLDSKKQTDIYEKKWHMKIEAQLEGNVSKFYRDYLQYKTVTSIKVVSDEKVDTNTKEVYQLFKEYVKNNFSNNEAFVDDIIQFVPWYKWIIYEIVTDKISDDPIKDKEIKELLRNIFHDIKSEAFKPFILGLFEYNQKGVDSYKLSDSELIEILKVIRIYLIRRRVLGLTKGENKDIVLLCDKIGNLCNQDVSMIELLCNQFYGLRLPNDIEVAERLRSVNFYKDMKKYSKFILAKIEEHNSKVTFDFRDSKIIIEHIMPIELTHSWKYALGKDYEEIHSKYLHNLGNLILTDFGKEIGSKSFADKQQILKKSALNYRLDIINRNSWNEIDIKEHREKMISWFLQTFSLPDKFKNASNWNTTTIQKVSLSPLDTEAGEMAEGSKPSKLIINNEIIMVKTWQDVFIEFLKWVKNSNDFDFDFIISNQEKFFEREDTIIKWKNLKLRMSEDISLRNKYKSFEKKFYDTDDITLLEDNLLFIHTNASAKILINRIAAIMDQFGIPEYSVEIVLE